MRPTSAPLAPIWGVEVSLKFWQLVSICRSDRSALAALLARPEWGVYEQWLEDFEALVERQDREALDARLPPDMVCAALQRLDIRLYLSGRRLRATMPGRPLAITEAWERFGGQAVEDALEYGSVEVSLDETATPSNAAVE